MIKPNEEALNLRGQFWLTGHADEVVPGRFYVNESKQCRLEVHGAQPIVKRMLDAGSIRILGRFENGKVVTLEKCFFLNHSWSSGGDATGIMHVNVALVGLHFEAGEEIALRGIRFHCDLVDEWLSLASITMEHAEDSERTTIVFDPPPDRAWTLADGTVVELQMQWSMPGAPMHRELEIKTQTYVSILFKDALPIEELLRASTIFNTFVSTVTDQLAVSDTIYAFSPAVEEPGCDAVAAKHLQIHIQPHSDVEAKLSWAHPPFSLFNFDSISDRFETILDHWFKHYRIQEAPIGLFFGTRTGRDLFLANRFLMLTQALEGFHRRVSNTKPFSDEEYGTLRSLLQKTVPGQYAEWLKPRLDYGNELSLRQRLRELFKGLEEVFGDRDKVRRLIGELVDARNELTHYDPHSKSNSTGGQQLYRLCVVAEMLFHVHLVTLFGFPLHEAANVYTGSQIFAWRALYLRDH